VPARYAFGTTGLRVPDGVPDDPNVPHGQLISVGSINADHQMRVERAPGTGTTLAGSLLRTSGGKGANVAYAVARWGGTAILVGSVGDDDLAALALGAPRAVGVDVRLVGTVSGGTGLSTVAVDAEGAKSILLALEANDEPYSDPDGLVRAIREAPDRSVLVVDGEVHRGLAAVALESGRGHLTVVLDPAPPERVDPQMLGAADHLVPDHHEASELSGVVVDDAASALRAARSLRRQGPTHVHVKLPLGGCASAGPDGECILEAPSDLDVVDTTGAGDAFAAGLSWALLTGATGTEAARVATAASACAVTAWGSQQSYPTLPALMEMVDRVRLRPPG
jgi:ribokinase